MRSLLACLVLFGLLLGCRSVSADDASLASLKKWIGHYPTDAIDGKTVWDNAQLKSLADELLDEKTLKVLYDELGQEIAAPIENDNDILKIYVCRAHACLMNSAILFVDTKKNKLHICWRNVYDKHDAWLSTGKAPQLLEVGDCDQHEGYDLYKNYVKE